MRNAGYTTGAFVSNWAAYYIVENLKSDYDFLPEPTFQEGGLQHLWEASGPLHQHTGIGNRADEYHDLEMIWNSAAELPDDLNLRYPAAESFARRTEDPGPDARWVFPVGPRDAATCPLSSGCAGAGTFHPRRRIADF